MERLASLTVDNPAAIHELASRLAEVTKRLKDAQPRWLELKRRLKG